MMDPVPQMRSALTGLRPVARDLSELKRMRDQSSPFSVAERLFSRAWSRLEKQIEPMTVCLETVADALAATRLAGIDAAMLTRLGVNPEERQSVLRRSFDDATITLGTASVDRFSRALGTIDVPMPDPTAPFVSALLHQPRAGATSPGKPRLALEPAESHGDHCLVVAVLGALIALDICADPAAVFLAGLAHHLHNAVLPDTGFAGEIMLGTTLVPLMQRLTAMELQSLAPPLRAHVEAALWPIATVDTPEAQAFNAADVIDRVLQAHHHGRAAAFTIEQALGDLQLVHEGPLQVFHMSVLSVLELA